MQFIMKKLLLICAIACLGLMGCEKNEEEPMLPPYYDYSMFNFMVCDAEGNCVFDKENFNMEELTLEFNGEIYTPIPEEEQMLGNKRLVFEPFIYLDIVTWSIYGDVEWGESARYILRYKDNEWVCDYSSEKLAHDGSVPEDELYVNGEKVEKIYAYTLPDHPDWERSEEERMVWVYPLYVK